MFLYNLVAFDEKINGECLEMRIFPKGYTLPESEFECNDAFYIGIRIKGGVILKKHIVDLTSTRRKFYDKLREKLDAHPDFNTMLLQK